MPLLLPHRAMGARLQTQHQLQLGELNLSHKLHRQIFGFVLRSEEFSEKFKMQLDARLEIFYGADFERHAGRLWRGSILFGLLAGRHRKIV